MPATRTEFYDKYYDQYWFDILYRKLYEHYGYGKYISILFARLRPQGQLKPHVDGGISVVHNHDVHVPITTNQDCMFTVGEETRHLDTRVAASSESSLSDIKPGCQIERKEIETNGERKSARN